MQFLKQKIENADFHGKCLIPNVGVNSFCFKETVFINNVYFAFINHELIQLCHIFLCSNFEIHFNILKILDIS